MRWRRFLESLDTPGGHIVLLGALFSGGVAMTCCGVPKGEDVLVGAFSALLIFAKARGGN